MRKSINKMVGYRVAAALISVVLFSVVTTVNIMRIKAAEAENAGAFALLNRAQTAEAVRRQGVHRQHRSHHLRSGQVALRRGGHGG